MNRSTASAPACLQVAGLGDAAVTDWTDARQERTSEFERDRHAYSQFWQQSDDLLQRLPPKRKRGEAEVAAAEAILATTRDHRERFLAAHGEAVYERLTHNRSVFVRLEELVFEAAMAIPGLTPTKKQVAAESSLLQRDKDGIEIDQGIFLAHMLAHESTGSHLCHSMLLPRPE